MKKLYYIMLMMVLLPMAGAVSSCSETDEIEGEWDNWQKKNDDMTAQWAANSAFTKILTYSKDFETAKSDADFIYVEKIENGSGTTCPLYTDTVRVAYRTRLIPTATYAEGLVVDQSFTGNFSWQTANFIDGANWIDGFATAVQNMHVGDYWRVYIPYPLAYGASSDSNRPAYSNMVFEIALLDFWHPGETRPPFKARQR